MSTQVTVTVPDGIYWQAERLARMTGRDVATVLVETLRLSLSPLDSPPQSDPMASQLSDDALFAAMERQLAPSIDRRLSVLLNRQQAGVLLDGERAELLTLMRLYEDGLLRKAEALCEAVARGLIPPLAS